MNLIGITGKAGTGKDTLAKIIVEEYGFAQYALAHPMKAAMCAAFDLPMHVFEDRELKEQTIAWIGKSPRQLMQLFGTEFGRRLVRDEIWLMVAERRREWLASTDTCSGMVVSDIRFPDEAAWIRACGGLLIHLDRPGVEAVSAHSSENGVSMEDGDALIQNNGSIDDLSDKLTFLLSEKCKLLPLKKNF